MILLLIVCIGLAVMLVAGLLSPVLAGGIFAAALAILGILSHGFRMAGRSPG
jgi:hypothetical protein